MDRGESEQFHLTMSPRFTRYALRKAQRREPVAFWLSTWFGCGLAPIAPGTAGTIGAVPLYLAVSLLGAWAHVAATLAVFVVGVAVSSRIERVTRSKDPQIVVIDEVAGVLVAWLAAPPTLAGLIAGIVLFRAFDISKPFPCRWCEQRFPGGWGIMLDDVCAGVWAAAALILLRLIGVL